MYDNNPAADYFEINSQTGYLTVKKRIDLESREIIMMGGLLEFKIIAYEIDDESSTAQAQVTVAIVDRNDNKPEFDSKAYNLRISPNSMAGTSLTLMKDSIHIFDLDKVNN